jgi:effector-binding domain-containing protein
MPAGPVSLVTVEPRPTIVIAETTTWDEYPRLWRALLDELYAFVRTNPELAAAGERARWTNVMLYKDDRPSVEVGVLAPGSFTPEGRIIASALPAGRTATATHHGDYAELGVTHRAVLDYLEAHGLELAGPRWEIYGHPEPDPDEQTPEIYWLLR